MAMNVGSRENETTAEMNSTPLIDVMLVLLVMLIITIPIQTHAVKLDLPTNLRPKPPPPVVNLGVEFDGRIIWNGTPVSLQQLDAYFVQESNRGADQDEIHVNPDGLAKYDTVAKVMADAQRLGVTKIGLGNSSEYVK